MKEIWKGIEDYPNYEISSHGRVRSLNYKGTGRIGLLKPRINGIGYALVWLFKDGVGRTYSIHRLVAKAFIPNPDGKTEIDHINANRSDNRLENLRWASSSENSQNPITNKRQSVAAYQQYVKVSQYTLDGKFIRVWDSIASASKGTGVCDRTIWRICTGRTKNPKKFIWHYADAEYSKFSLKSISKRAK